MEKQKLALENALFHLQCLYDDNEFQTHERAEGFWEAIRCLNIYISNYKGKDIDLFKNAIDYPKETINGKSLLDNLLGN